MMLLLALLQAPLPTVGDTIWLERAIAAPPGAEVRPGAWAPEGDVTLLGHPVMRREGGQVIIAYPAAAWRTGRLTVEVPGPVLIQADGRTDSLPSERRTLEVASVLPADSQATAIGIQPAAGLVTRLVRTPWPAAALLLAAALLFAPLAWWWRRRGPAVAPLEPEVAPAEPPFEAWAEAGEGRALAAVAMQRLRATIAARVAAAGPGLVPDRLVRVLEEQRPQWPVEEIGAALRALEAAQYAERTPGDVRPLAQRALDLARRIEAAPR